MPHQCTNCGHVFDDGSKEMLSGCPDCGGNKFQYHPGDVPDPEEPPEEAEPPEREGGSVTGAVGRAANKVRDAVTSDDATPVAGDAPETVGVDGDAGADTAPDSATTDAEPDAGTADDRADAPTASDGADTPTASDSADTPTVDAEPDASTADADADAAAADAESATATGEVDGDSADADPAAADPTTETVDATTAEAEDGAQANARSEVVDMSSLPDRAEDGRVVQEPDDDEDRPDLEELRQELNDQFESIRIVAPGQYELNLMELYDRQEYIIALQEDGQYVIEVPDAWEAPDPTEDE